MMVKSLVNQNMINRACKQYKMSLACPRNAEQQFMLQSLIEKKLKYYNLFSVLISIFYFNKLELHKIIAMQCKKDAIESDYIHRFLHHPNLMPSGVILG